MFMIMDVLLLRALHSISLLRYVVTTQIQFIFFFNVYLYSYLLHVTCFLSVILVLYILNNSLSAYNTQFKCGTLFTIKKNNAI